MDIWTIILLILLAVGFIASYLHPVTGWFVRKYFWQILSVLLGIGVTILVMSMGRKDDDNPVPLEGLKREVDSKLQVIDLEAKIKLMNAEADFEVAEETHSQLSEELEVAKSTTDIDERLAKLAELSNKVV